MVTRMRSFLTASLHPSNMTAPAHVLDQVVLDAGSSTDCCSATGSQTVLDPVFLYDLPLCGIWATMKSFCPTHASGISPVFYSLIDEVSTLNVHAICHVPRYVHPLFAQCCQQNSSLPVLVTCGDIYIFAFPICQSCIVFTTLGRQEKEICCKLNLTYSSP